MKQKYLERLTLYRFRYAIGYVLIFLFLIGLSIWQLGQIPLGYSERDLESIQTSATLSLSEQAPVSNLPFHLLQKFTLSIFGVTPLGTLLPGALIGIVSGVALLALLLRLFRQNVAIITTLLAVTASQFLIATRSATPDVMMLFWPIIIILLATLVSQQVKHYRFWRYLLTLAIILSLYTPMMIYLVVAALIAALVHPHLRFIMRYDTKPIGYILTAIVGLALLAPMAWIIYNDYEKGIALLGLPGTLPDAGTYFANLKFAILSWVNVLHPSITTMITPAFNIGTLVLMLFGFIQVLRDHHSSRSYVILIWLACLLPLISFRPEQIIVLFVPAIILLGIGVQSLVREWYKLFPRNPYARISGLLPLSILMGSMLAFNFTSYFYGFGYYADRSQYFSNDLALVQQTLDRDFADQKVTLVVPKEQVGIYDLLRRTYPNVTVADTPSASRPLLVQNDAASGIKTAASDVVVSSDKSSPLRFVVYR